MAAMAPRIADTDPDEVDGRRRPRWWIPAGVVVVAGLAAVVGYVVWGDSDAPTQAAGTAATVAGTMPGSGSTAPTAPPVVFGFPDSGSDYVGPKLEDLYRRSTDSGIDLVLQHAAGGGVFPAALGTQDGISSRAVGSGSATDVTDATDATGALSIFVSTGGDGSVTIVRADSRRRVTDSTADVIQVDSAVSVPGGQPVPGVDIDTGWTPPGWCSPTGTVRLAAMYQGSISVSNGPEYEVLRDGIRVTMFSAGQADGTPYRLLVVQLDPGATEASVAFSDGRTDRAAVNGRWAVLATAGDPNGKFTLTITRPGGRQVIDWSQLPRDGDAESASACSPPAT